jgi:hypothetical protein
MDTEQRIMTDVLTPCPSPEEEGTRGYPPPPIGNQLVREIPPFSIDVYGFSKDVSQTSIDVYGFSKYISQNSIDIYGFSIDVYDFSITKSFFINPLPLKKGA